MKKFNFSFDEEAQREEAYRQGMQAKENNLTLDDNPYPVYSTSSRAWGEGWVAIDSNEDGENDS